MRSTLGKISELALGAILIASGAAGMAAWKVGAIRAVTICEGCAPMQFNTALGFFFFGLGVVFSVIGPIVRAHSRRYTYIAGSPVVRALRVFCGGIIIALGSTALYQWGAGVDIGVDQMFHSHQYTAHTPEAGRMAPNTAVAFLLSGCALVLLNIAPLFCAVVASGALMAGIAALIGYQFGIPEFYAVTDFFTFMALPTAALFVTGGIALMARCAIEFANKTQKKFADAA